MPFVESPRFPDSISEGASGGPTFKTNVFTTIVGLEQRQSKWTRAKHTYDFSLGIRDMDDMNDVRDFFIAARARVNSFRFKDWNDFELVDETVGTGDGTRTEFQITKTYTTGAYSYTRTILKPVAGIEVRLDSSLQEIEIDYTLDLTTGIITFLTPPGNGVLVKVTGEFDVPVRFDTDAMEASHIGYDAQDWSSVTLIEDLNNSTVLRSDMDAGFIETPRFDDVIAYGSSGGPGFKTFIFEGDSGLEGVVQNWELVKSIYNIEHALRDKAVFNTVRSFFYNTQGRARGFRFKDHFDYQAVDEPCAGVVDGDNVTFKLMKHYTVGNTTFSRRISKPVSGTTVVKVNGSIVSAGINTTTGTVTLLTAPTEGQTVTASFEFDVPVRFDTDQLSASYDGFQMQSWDNTVLVELIPDE